MIAEADIARDTLLTASLSRQNSDNTSTWGGLPEGWEKGRQAPPRHQEAKRPPRTPGFRRNTKSRDGFGIFPAPGSFRRKPGPGSSIFPDFRLCACMGMTNFDLIGIVGDIVDDEAARVEAVALR
ncbi:MAG: hypothetical protein LBE85_04485 [Candidatus Accumulibacter sp.]|nr:hypothetical protein [Accumulibacter sp.]